MQNSKERNNILINQNIYITYIHNEKIFLKNYVKQHI